jgi:hypothetical protein
MARGVAGITRAAVGVGTGSHAMVEARRAVCRSCEHNTGTRCTVCKCFLRPKTALRSERCPLGKWSDER